MLRLLIVFAAVLALALPAAAQPGPDACVADTKASPDDQVASCTAIIAAGPSVFRLRTFVPKTNCCLPTAFMPRPRGLGPLCCRR